MTTLDLYGTFLYGEGFYGIDSIAVGPKAPENLYVIREPSYNIIKWDPVVYNTDGTVCTPTRYIIYKTNKTNLLNITFVKEITTLDVSGKLDTCYVDQLTGTAVAEDFLYLVVCLNSDLIVGLPTDFSVDIFINKNSVYENTTVYAKYKNNLFYKILEDIPPSDFFDTEYNVLPYMMNTGYLLVDFFTTIAPMTTLSVWINDVNIGSNYNRNAGEFFYFNIPVGILPYSGSVKIEIKSSTSLLKTYYFKTYNYLTFVQTLAGQLEGDKLEAKTVQNDIYKDDARLDKIYTNFGFPFDFVQPNYLTNVQYRNLISGDSSLPGLYLTFANHGGTYTGINDVVRSVTGYYPAISTYRDDDGWVLINDVTDDSGTATAGGAATLSDVMKVWDVDTFVGDVIEITGGTGQYQLRKIISNTMSQLTVYPNWATPPNATSTYVIHNNTAEEFILEMDVETNVLDTSGTSSTLNTLTDTLKVWYNDMWKNYTVTIISGTGETQQRAVLSNTTDTLTLDADWTTLPDATSVYEIQQLSDHDIAAFSIPYQLYTLKVSVYNGLRTIVGEQLNTTAAIDYVDGTYIIGDIAIEDESGHSYTPGVDFTIDATTGKITWVGAHRPAANTLIYCSYTFILYDLIKHLLDLIKEAHYRILIEFWTGVYGFGYSPFGVYPFGCP